MPRELPLIRIDPCHGGYEVGVHANGCRMLDDTIYATHHEALGMARAWARMFGVTRIESRLEPHYGGPAVYVRRRRGQAWKATPLPRGRVLSPER